jgi:hypothetical protein
MDYSEYSFGKSGVFSSISFLNREIQPAHRLIVIKLRKRTGDGHMLMNKSEKSREVRHVSAYANERGPEFQTHRKHSFFISWVPNHPVTQQPIDSPFLQNLGECIIISHIILNSSKCLMAVSAIWFINFASAFKKSS